MDVIATAGHVDHGKSTLVRALTGMEPDRLAEERRRGLTIDLGFAWTTLPSGREVAFVDVPGHERFLGNMLAGVGPAPVVCLVVAADQGWQAQSSDHRDAIVALGIEHGLVAITRADLATPQQLAGTEAQIRARLRGTPLARAPIVVVSAIDHSGADPNAQAGPRSRIEPGMTDTARPRTANAASHVTPGAGLDTFVRRLDEVLAAVPPPDPDARVRLWVDRSFSIRGAGTVVTGTLTAGTLRRGDRLHLVGESGERPVSVRGLHSRNAAAETVTPYARAAVNLRDLAADAVHRGDALVSSDAWPIVNVVDVRRVSGDGFADGPREVVMHVGTAAIPARVRPFGDDHARLTLRRALPLQVADRLVLRSPGGRAVLAGALVLDVDPPALRRRGDGRRRTAELATRPATGDPAAEVARRGAVRLEQLRRLGVGGLGTPPDEVEQVRQHDVWWVHRPALRAWARRLRQAVDRKLSEEPLAPGLSEGAAAGLLRRQEPGLPDEDLLPLVVRAAGLESLRGTLRPPDHPADLGEAEAAVVRLERRLGERPFAAPEADELTAWRLGPAQLAAAERAGRLLRLSSGVVLLPDAPALAMRRLATLAQPFTTSEARQALATTRRVAIPLLEHLDAHGWTRRIDGARRTIVR